MYYMEGKIEMQSSKDIMLMSGERTSISVSKDTKDRISNFGRAGESLETALIRALDMADEHKKCKKEEKVERGMGNSKSPLLWVPEKG